MTQLTEAPASPLPTGSGEARPSPSRRRDRLAPYVAISPFLVLFAVFSAYPIISGAWLSLHEWNGLSSPEFIGFENFRQILADPLFWQATATTVLIFIGSTVPLLLLALLAAFAVSALRGRTRAVVETFLISPVVISIVAAALIFQALFSESYGLVNAALGAVGLQGVPWLSSPVAIKFVIILMVVWKNLGYFAVIFMAGIATVPAEIVEAARLDGAGNRLIVTRIVLPTLRPIVVFCVLTASVGTFQTFAEPQVLVGTTGGVENAGLTLMLYQFARSFQPGAVASAPEFGYASAVGWLVFVMLVIISAAGFALTRRVGKAD